MIIETITAAILQPGDILVRDNHTEAILNMRWNDYARNVEADTSKGHTLYFSYDDEVKVVE